MTSLLAVSLVPACTTAVGNRVNVKEYPFLANTSSIEAIVWRKLTGPDFDVFYGQPKSNSDRGFGFYRGGHPNFQPSEGATRIKGRLGAFDLDWYESMSAGRVYRAGVFDYQTQIVKIANLGQEIRYTEKVHVWVYGTDRMDVEALAEYLGGLELFHERLQDQIEVR